MKTVKSITNYNDYKCSDYQFPMNISLLYYSLKLGKKKNYNTNVVFSVQFTLEQHEVWGTDTPQS